jgi:hypothetical protein
VTATDDVPEAAGGALGASVGAVTLAWAGAPLFESLYPVAATPPRTRAAPARITGIFEGLAGWTVCTPGMLEAPALVPVSPVNEPAVTGSGRRVFPENVRGAT